MNLGEYLAYQKNVVGEQAYIFFLQSLNKDAKLRKFLKWIYDTSPHYFVPDLVLAFQKIVLYYQFLKFHGLQLHEIL
jgi:hypothetical protein